jgi:Xaa-Pro aminopeptidase
MKRAIAIIVLILISTTAIAQDMPTVVTMRQRAEVINKILGHRLETVMPELMKETGIDLWLVMAREYNEDPVIRTMLPGESHAARRLTMLMFFNPGDGKEIEKLAVARYDVGEFKKSWNPDEEPDQWKCLAKLIAARNPKKIGLNYSKEFNHADGLTKHLYDSLYNALTPELQGRIVSAEDLAVRWLETRTEMEMAIYPMVCRLAHAIIAEGFSEQVIQPGITSTKDVQWWYRERIRELKLRTWFHPSVSIQRANTPKSDFVSNFTTNENVIMPGDLLHVDFGITYLRMNTDTQEHAYVLRMGETEAPQGLKDAMAAGNKLQDFVTSNFLIGRTGNEVLALARQQAIAAGLKPSVYSHPIGYHGHAAGTTIGMWDNQGITPGDGEWPLHANTAYSIELNVTTSVPEWNDKEIRIMLEQDAFFDGKKVTYIDGRQTELHLIARQK